MDTSLLDYHLPGEAIAQRPLPDREAARLMVLKRAGLEHRSVGDFPELLEPGSLMVVNETRVRRARLLGTRRKTGGKVEVLLLRALTDTSLNEAEFVAIARAGRRLTPDTIVDAAPFCVEVLAELAQGELKVRVLCAENVERELSLYGHVPIPPYVRRPDNAEDSERYQTIYAKTLGSVAAPTAGLHLSRDMLERIERRRVQVSSLTLHVGTGTFRPVKTQQLEDHTMHSEWFEVPASLCEAIADARRRGAPVVAVGTTVVRALESAADPARPGLLRPTCGETALMIRPGHSFQVVDALLTNFHTPKSTLLALVAAFAGLERVLFAYAEAVRLGYRMLSYGDAMWIPARLP